MIEYLSIDLETKSGTDLSKSGVYRYTEDPEFEILLFGYSVNGGEVSVIDVACGEQIPEEVLRAIVDESVRKWAFNAAFERICLSAWLRKNRPDLFCSYSIPEDSVGNYLNPASWKCSLIWSAYIGLPLSLEGVGAVLKLQDQKMTEGKALIKYFSVPCKPTKVNGGRLWNRPQHAPDKWATFKAYNKRDVEVEMSIQKVLAKFPVPDSVWEEYHLSEQINDRGIGLDRQMVEQAIQLDAQSRDELSTEMQKLTQLENPNSVAQMKQWLADHGLEVDSLDKKAVKELLKTAPPELAKGKIAELALGYGGSVGALKAMGALDMGLKEEELQPLVSAWRQSNPNIVAFWWDVDDAVKNAIRGRSSTEIHSIRFIYQSGMLFIVLPSGRRLAYVKPKIGENRFGGESVTYEGVGATKKWERMESYGPKFVENIVQAISRDILCYAMRTLSHCFICGHIHDELIIEASEGVDLNAVCEQMSRVSPWLPGAVLRADGYETKWYRKD